MPFLNTSDTPGPSTRRWFGLSLALLLLLLGYALRKWHPYLLGTAAACSLTLAIVYYTLSTSQPAVIRTWYWVTRPLAWTVGHVLLMLVYYGVLLPLALGLRAIGHDPLALRTKSRQTGWVERRRRPSPDDYFKQF